MTGLNSNINELISRFEKAKNVKVDLSEALIGGVNAARGEMVFRIFNKGLDTEGKPLGKYRGSKSKAPLTKEFKGKKKFIAGDRNKFTPYELIRIKAGRQVQYKDLEFKGDLRRGILVIKESANKVVCAIVNEKLQLISRGQEEDLNTIIFTPSKEELETMSVNVTALLKQLYVRYFNPDQSI